MGRTKEYSLVKGVLLGVAKKNIIELIKGE
jgi:hypothetical protein